MLNGVAEEHFYCRCQMRMRHDVCVQETFGAMAKTEKIFYILEQVRLCLDRKDFIRCVS